MRRSIETQRSIATQTKQYLAVPAAPQKNKIKDKISFTMLSTNFISKKINAFYFLFLYSNAKHLCNQTHCNTMFRKNVIVIAIFFDFFFGFFFFFLISILIHIQSGTNITCMDFT